MLKSEFVKRVMEMTNPVLEEYDDEARFWELIRVDWCITDDTPGVRCWFDLPSVKLTSRELRKEKTLDRYYARVDRARKKYQRWFREAISNKTG